MKTLLTSFFALLLTTTTYAEVPQAELNALKDFYEATQGENWDQKWNLENNVSDLPGITVENDHVTEIRMLFNNITGTLPA